MTKTLHTIWAAIALLAVVRPESLVGNYGLQVWLGFDRMWHALVTGGSRCLIDA